MVDNKRLDPYIQIIAALLSDVQTSCSEVFTPRALRLTLEKVRNRCAREGISLLTKTLPRLGKAFDRALSGEVMLDSTGWTKVFPGSKLPRFLGELFQCVFSHDGMVLPAPCMNCVTHIRQILFVYYKLELPYNVNEEEAVVSQFVKSETDIAPYDDLFSKVAELVDCEPQSWDLISPTSAALVLRRARKLLAKLFSDFDPLDIHPRHGPGAVSTKEKLWGKYFWTRLNPRINRTYAFDAYFFASLGHVCDEYRFIESLPVIESSAQVLLVPKDSRGPRLISCEPLEFQWIQQGLGQAIVHHVEHHPLTRYNVHFTDQQPNRIGALLGSRSGRYATLDLKEASDRVTVGLVRLLFPEPLLSALLNSRSLTTRLTNGEVLRLHKFAPMGSALCFPVMALTIWALLTANESDANARESILVYGDDVIVEAAKAAHAIQRLESVGLMVNRNKSFCQGFFKESCGLDAFHGIDVTPVRLRTLWTNDPSPDVYTSYIAFANKLYERRYYTAYDVIVGKLLSVYREIPSKDMNLSCPSLYSIPDDKLPKRRRVNKDLQKSEFLVYDVISRPLHHTLSGWKMLLRFFAEGTSDTLGLAEVSPSGCGIQGSCFRLPMSVREYTKRNASILAKRWR